MVVGLCTTMQVSTMAVIVGEDRERKCADTTDTVLVPWAGHPQC